MRIEPSGHIFAVEGSESLLEAALRAGLALEYGCSVGSCGKCKARVVSGTTLKTHHSDYPLTAAEKTAGVVLMCCNSAAADLVIEAGEAHGAADMPVQTIEARVKSVGPLGEDMRLLHLQTPRTRRLRFLAGQSVTLELPGGESVSLPVASCPCDDRNLHFHVRRRPGKAFADAVFGALKATDPVQVEGPRGEFVLDEKSPRTPVFIAWEDGFAPVKSLVEHAMARDTGATLHLYWIAAGAKGHYLDNLCRAWSDALDEFSYTAVTVAADLPPGAAMRHALGPLLREHPRLEACDLYFCAPASIAAAAVPLLTARGLPRAQLLICTPGG